MSDTDRWQQIEDVFHGALERAPGERDSYLTAACASDADLRAQVNALLSAHGRAENPLDSPAFELAAGLPFPISSFSATGGVIGHYQILAQLGKGGMGAVYLAIHQGTRRYVALKIIAPELMAQQEFVTRFRHEAEAAGRLRHPNVVDVTDFGFARLGAANIAYLVMEYLDGCALSEILAEEVRLPLMWVVDILEQACSAVDEAHQQGTIHRDLKPENIWLEPNRRGGYTVKVLDFGLAKLASASQVKAERALDQSGPEVSAPALPPSIKPLQPTDAGPNRASLDEAARLMPKIFGEEAVTLALRRESAAKGTGSRNEATQKEAALLTPPDDGLTRFGSLMGTPLYMSPEQCRGQRLGPQSDIYGLGVIAYQMLSGRTPFTGEVDAVIRSQLEAQPTPLREISPRTPKKIAALIMSALAKDPAARPQSAAAFASALRARAEGTSALLRRAFAIFSEHFPTFLRISVISYLPWLALLSLQFGAKLLIYAGVTPSGAARTISVTLNLLSFLVNALCNATITGVVVPIIIQLIVTPLRPIQIRAAFALLRRRLRPFITTSLLVISLTNVGMILCIVPGLIMSVIYALCVPVVIIENLRNWAALRRSHTLVRRAPWSATFLVLLKVAIPLIVSLIIGRKFVSVFNENIEFGPYLLLALTTLSNLLTVPLITIIAVLLYLKTRQAGGETLRETLAQFEEEETPRRKWQMRIRERRLMLDRQSP
jgi:serine/threonine protein kinase